jgi:hypothetical protein
VPIVDPLTGEVMMAEIFVAVLVSLIENCKLNEVNPLTYMTELLTRLVNGWPQDRINELMPWCWKPQPDA